MSCSRVWPGCCGTPRARRIPPPATVGRRWRWCCHTPLPHTDLEGAYAIAERIRVAIAAMRIPRLDHEGILGITASLGVAASSDGSKDALIADADAALYTAKRDGKNRTVQAASQTANAVGGE